ncbi:MAG TPA: hypothetical protein VM328_04310 [Fimbriimonadaceae bacterium]|nr:hypothetical protein [Fimbriimonadaceae bacterium]
MRWIVPTLLGAACFTAATPADAQVTQSSGISLRAGLFFPSDSAARDEGASWFAFGADYRLGDLQLGMTPGYTAHLSLSADVFSKGDYRNVPVLLNYVGRTSEFYYSAGAGFGFGRVAGEARTRFAYALGVGYDFMQGAMPLFAEAKYFGSSDSALNGFAVFVGIRL